MVVPAGWNTHYDLNNDQFLGVGFVVKFTSCEFEGVM